MGASSARADGDHAGVPGLVGGELWLPLRDRILRLDPLSLQAEPLCSHPCFHDLHSVAAFGGGALVTSTGNELVLALDPAGEIRERWALGAPVDEALDHRPLPPGSLKPHRVHPNYACQVGERILVTGLRDQRCRDLLDPSFVLSLPQGPPHDGRLREDRLWFTTTNGWVVACCPRSGAQELALQIGACEGGEGLGGWCRGIEVAGDRLWIGLSRVRRSRLRDVARTALRPLIGSVRSARVVEIDWRQQRVLREFPLDAPGGAEIYGLTLHAGGEGA